MRLLVFDARFEDGGGQGQVVDGDIRVELYDSSPFLQATRLLGTDRNTHIVQSTDSNGVFYTTTVDVSLYPPGPVTAKWYAKRSFIPVDPYPFVEVLPYPAAVLGESELKDYVRTMLGFPAVIVELTGASYTAAIDKALGVYNQYLPRENSTTISLIPGQNKYPMPSLPNKGPTDVTFIRKEGLPIISDPLFGRAYPRVPMIQFDEYALTISYWETLNRITGQEPAWTWVPQTRDLYLNLGGNDPAGEPPLGSYHVMVRYYESVSLDGVREEHVDWFRSMVLAVAKRILGRIRGKFSGVIPSPGKDVILDAQSLLDEGKQEEEELTEKARGMMPAVPPVLG